MQALAAPALAPLLGPVLALAGSIEASAVGAAMRGGVRGLYAWVNVAHLIGLVMLVGGIGVLDLRVAGLGRAVPVAALSRMLTPVAVAGLVLMLASGALLFTADAGPLVRSRVFLAKVALIALALLNALLFRRRFGDLADGREPPPLARGMAVLSLGLWASAGVLGRMIAYT